MILLASLYDLVPDQVGVQEGPPGLLRVAANGVEAVRDHELAELDGVRSRHPDGSTHYVEVDELPWAGASCSATEPTVVRNSVGLGGSVTFCKCRPRNHLTANILLAFQEAVELRPPATRACSTSRHEIRVPKLVLSGCQRRWLDCYASIRNVFGLPLPDRPASPGRHANARLALGFRTPRAPDDFAEEGKRVRGSIGQWRSR